MQLLHDAALQAGRIALDFWQRDPHSWEKPGNAGPVSEADIAVNDALKAVLTAARPDYGWLSEESEADASRLDAEYCFIIDPIDGTRAFLAGQEGFSHSLAISRNDRIVAAVVHLPVKDATYTAFADGPAMLNGAVIAPTAVRIEGATVLTYRAVSDPVHWQDGIAPPFRREFRPSLAWRLCLVAEGKFDAALSLRSAWEWDIAAGCLIAERAGATVTDRLGMPMRFNNPAAMTAGIVIAGQPLHHDLISRLRNGPA